MTKKIFDFHDKNGGYKNYIIHQTKSTPEANLSQMVQRVKEILGKKFLFGQKNQIKINSFREKKHYLTNILLNKQWLQFFDRHYFCQFFFFLTRDRGGFCRRSQLLDLNQ